MAGRTLGLGVALAGAASVAIGSVLLYAGGPPPAPPRPKPPAVDQTSAAMKYSATLYRALLEQDAGAFGLPVVRPEEMARPFPYFQEGGAGGDHKLKVGGSIQTPHLRLSLLVRKEAGSMEGQAYSADHLVLRIDNLTNKTLAYRVETTVPDEERCAAKGVIAQNAIVLFPGQSVSRTECFFRSDQRITVKSIDVMEVPRLSGFYLSRLVPGLVLYGVRTSAGHSPPKGGPCPQTVSWRDIRDGADRGDFGWRDVIDFYARHSCAEYAFFPAYRFRATAAAPLPARPPGQDL